MTNPEGITVGGEENDRADRALLEALQRLRLESFRVAGGSADFRHAEPGHRILCSRETALGLAAQFRQEAVFEVRDGRVFLVPADPAVAGDDEIGLWRDLLV